MRGTVNKWLSWSISSETERPDWKVWRDRADSVDSDPLADTVSVSSGLAAGNSDLQVPSWIRSMEGRD